MLAKCAFSLHGYIDSGINVIISTPQHQYSKNDKTKSSFSFIKSTTTISTTVLDHLAIVTFTITLILFLVSMIKRNLRN